MALDLAHCARAAYGVVAAERRELAPACGVRRDGRRHRVARAALERAGEQQRRVVAAVVHDGHDAGRERAGLVQDDGVDAAGGLEHLGPAHEDAELRAAAGAHVLSRPSTVPAPTGADKTTLFLYMREDHPGALLEILTEFSVRGVNLTRIESRPTRKALGDYFFSVDCEGHVADARVGEALMGLHRICASVRFLGSYPRHDGKEPLLRAGVTDVDFAAARAWLDAVRGPGRTA